MGHDPQPRKRRTRLAQAVLSGVAVLSIAGAAGFWLAGQAGNPPGATSYLGTGPGQFDGPTGLVLDRQGNLFAVDQGNNRLQELSAGGRPLAQWGTRGSGSLQFNAPSDVDISPDGRIYVVDHANSRIPVLRNGKQIDEIEAYASGVAVDSRGMIYAPDSFHHWMNIYAPNDSTRPAVSWPISEIHAGRRPYPAGLAVDEQGDVYMADRSDNRVIELSPRGEPLFTFGMAGHGPAQFDDPTDVALGAGGTIYVADAKNDRVCRFSATGRLLRTWGSPGSELGQFSRPSSVAVDPRGNIYVSDYYNNRVQKFSASGKVLWATHGSQPLVPSS
jgi:DNA-binding beta-propeller fold protein YncE